MNIVLGKLYLSRENMNIVARVEAWEKRDGKHYILFSVLDLSSVTDWVPGAALEENQFPELYPHGPLSRLVDAADERSRQLGASKIKSNPTIRITLTHEYTVRPESYPPGSTVEEMMAIDQRDGGALDLIESAIENGEITITMEVMDKGE